jgi:hypothetical protein
MSERLTPPPLPDPVAFLSGRWSGWHGRTEPDGVRAPWPKFAGDGRVLPFPGVTIVCHVPPRSATFEALVAIQNRLKAADFAEHFSYLPPPSFHMTLFDVSNELRRGTSAWPTDVAGDASWPALTDEMDARLHGLRLPRFHPRASGVFAGFSVALEGRHAEAEDAMRDARDLLRDRTGVHRSDHDTYDFHITLAYPLRFVPEDVARAVAELSDAVFVEHEAMLNPVTLGPAELCDFEDMHAFVPRLTLS